MNPVSGNLTRSLKSADGAVRIAGIRGYSRRKILMLARRAAEESLIRLQNVARRANAGDPRLRRFLGNLVAEAEDLARFIGQVEEAVQTSPLCRDNDRGIARILRIHLTSGRRTIAVKWLDRDAALRLCQSLGQGLSRFYYLLSDHVPDESLSKFFRRLARSVEFAFESPTTEIF